MFACAFSALLAAPTVSSAAPGTTSVGIVQDGTTVVFRVLGDGGDNAVTIAYDKGHGPSHEDDKLTVHETSAGGELDINGSFPLCSFGPGDDRTTVICTMPQSPATPVSLWTIDGQNGNDDLRLIGDVHGLDTPGNGEDYAVSMFGGPGNDVIYGSNGVEVIYGDGGQSVAGAPASDGNDEIHDGLGNRDDRQEVIYGGGGDDVVVQSPLTSQNPSTDQDTIDLGDGFDTVSYAARDADHAVNVSINQNTPNTGSYNDGTPGEQDFLGPDVERVIGSAGNDEFIGTPTSAASVTYEGGPGDDLFRTSTRDETIFGGPGTDTVTYASQSGSFGVSVTADDNANDGVGANAEHDNVHSDVERIVGSPQADDLQGAPIAGCIVAGAEGDDTVRAPTGAGCVLEGGDGSDTIIGGAGNDVVHPGASSSSGAGDTITFGGGIDTVDYSVVGLGGGMDVVEVMAGATTAGMPTAGCDGLGVGAVSARKTVGDSGSADDVDSFTDAPERLVGTNGNDTLCAGAGATELVGGEGSDRLYGWTGNDVIDGGPGDDAVYGQEGNDTLRGSDGNDFVNGGSGSDSVDGGPGDDTVRGGAGSDIILGGDGNDTLTELVFSTTPSVGGTAPDEADTLDGGAGDDLIDGAIGDDRIICSTGTDTTRDTGSGVDTVDCSALGQGARVNAGSGIDRVLGSQAGDVIVGSDTALTIDGQGGDDQITGSSAADSIDGGAGSDVINGGEGSDHLVGGFGSDVLNGGGGDDTLEGGSGADVLRGGSGSDTVNYSLRASGVTITAGGGADDGIAGEFDDVGGDIEVLVGSGFNDVIRAGSVPSTITGGDGDDRIVGSGAADALDGGAGNDDISGGGGDDSIAGQGGNDSLDGGTGDDSVFGGDGDDTLDGGDGADALDGGVGNDDLDGGAGSDNLMGGIGADALDGGVGADVLSGGVGTDTVTYATRTKPVVVTVGTKANDGEKNERDDVRIDVERIIGGRSNDTLIGGKGNQQLFGGSGKDKLDGGFGNDKLYGGAGNDTLLGGPGFDLLAGQSGNDVLRSRELPGKRGLRDRLRHESVDGGPGKDVAQVDAADRVKHVERLLK